ncbi:hypothetical protein FS837_004616 [Tulasnella sp. UAMH 9824]|nr:hypothetical protein FS837_004616 [Tulasnella sp. UAMH 9824]
MVAKAEGRGARRRSTVASFTSAYYTQFPVPDILIMILAMVDKPTQAIAARVCRRWNEVALSHLWRLMDSVFPLLKLLAPLEYFCQFQYHKDDLLKRLGAVDWNRFHHYAVHVRSLTHVETKQTPRLDAEAAAAMLFRHPFGSSLLPNLQEVYWTFSHEESTMFALAFMGPELDVLELGLGVSRTAAVDLLKCLAYRTPNLKDLGIGTYLRALHLSDVISSLISSLSNLERLHLPVYYQTEQIVRAIASRPKLKHLMIDWAYRCTYDESSMEPYFSPSFSPNLFTFNITTHVDACIDHFKSKDHCNEIDSLLLHCPTVSLASDVRKILAHVVASCDQLAQLTLMLYPQSGMGIDYLSFEDLEPLFACRGLELLEIAGPSFIPPTASQIQQMGKSWPALDILKLCQSPGPKVRLPIGMPVTMLPVFAKSFPEITYLALYLNEDRVQFDGEMFPEHQFPKLRALDLGLGPIPGGGHQNQEVGHYIASLCTELPALNLGCDTAWPGTIPENILRREPEWLQVEDAMELAMRTKAAVRKKLERMKAEFSRS